MGLDSTPKIRWTQIHYSQVLHSGHFFCRNDTVKNVTKMQRGATFLQEANKLSAGYDGGSKTGDNKLNLFKKKKDRHAGRDRERERGRLHHVNGEWY